MADQTENRQSRSTQTRTKITSLRLRAFVRTDPDAKMVRLGRVMWERGRPGFGGYSAKLSFALEPQLYLWVAWKREWVFCLAGVRVHYQRSYGGQFV